jgi:hypothetical protein
MWDLMIVTAKLGTGVMERLHVLVSEIEITSVMRDKTIDFKRSIFLAF